MDEDREPIVQAEQAHHTDGPHAIVTAGGLREQCHPAESPISPQPDSPVVTPSPQDPNNGAAHLVPGHVSAPTVHVDSNLNFNNL